MNKLKLHLNASLVLFSIISYGCSGEKSSEEKTKDDAVQMDGQAKEGKGSILIGGSDTLLHLAQEWATQYMKMYPDVDMQVSGGGTGLGISALMNGTVHLVNASRPMTKEEKMSLEKKRNVRVHEWKVAIEGVSVYLNKDNPIKELSLGQVKDIFTGKITNWKEVGGKNAPIVTYGRNSNSGTHVFFKEQVLMGEDFMTGVQVLPGISALLSAIQKDENGIGYSSKAYAVGVKSCKLKKEVNSKAYVLNKESITSGEYPLTRALYVYSTDENIEKNAYIKMYIDFILSDKGQAVVADSGYYKIVDMS